jgi:hypothetical protein
VAVGSPGEQDAGRGSFVFLAHKVASPQWACGKCEEPGSATRANSRR